MFVREDMTVTILQDFTRKKGLFEVWSRFILNFWGLELGMIKKIGKNMSNRFQWKARKFKCQIFSTMEVILPNLASPLPVILNRVKLQRVPVNSLRCETNNFYISKPEEKRYSYTFILTVKTWRLFCWVNSGISLHRF